MEVPDVTTVPVVSESITVSLYAVSENSVCWMLDSGCNVHVTPKKSDFVSYHDFLTPGYTKTTGQSQLIEIKGYGTVYVEHVLDNGDKRTLILQEVLYVPQASARFFVPSIPIKLGHYVKITSERFSLYHKLPKADGSPQLIFSGVRDKVTDLYWLQASVLAKAKPTSHLMSADTTFDLWHHRFGHARKKALEQLPGKVSGVPDKLRAPSTPMPCDGCEFGKSKRDSFPLSDSHSEHILDMVHMDLVEFPSLSIEGYKFTLTILDDYSYMGLSFFLKWKSDSFASFKVYVAWAETQTGRKLTSICSDRGGEFLSSEFNAFLREKGIERQLSVAHMPQQNGRAECWQQMIEYKAAAMRLHAGLSSGFWALATACSVHIYNRQPARRLKWDTPIKAWSGKILDVKYFRVFGCKAYVHIHKDARVNKLQAKAAVMIFVGYELGTKGYKFWNPES